jgi:hypothetical protein
MNALLPVARFDAPRRAARARVTEGRAVAGARGEGGAARRAGLFFFGCAVANPVRIAFIALRSDGKEEEEVVVRARRSDSS